MPSYDADRYWTSLHASGDDLRVVGYPTLPLAFNRAVYENAAAAVRRSLRRATVRVEGATVLDVGSGTGFWLDVWRDLGAAELAGVDLVADAVQELRGRFPDAELAVADIAEGPPFPERRFDLVSAMDVLLHVVEPERWRRAIASLEAQLAPGGAVVLREPVAVARHRLTAGETRHNATRTVAEWEDALAASGLRIVSIRASAYLLGDPVDGRTRAGLAARRLWWRALTRSLRGRERLARLAMPPLARLDRVLAAAAGPGPSAKCVVARRA